MTKQLQLLPVGGLNLVPDILELNYCTTLFHQPVHALSVRSCKVGRNIGQRCAAAKSLAVLAGKIRVAVAGKFPKVPKGYNGLVQQVLVVPSHWWNYGELWVIMGNYGGSMGNYGGILVELWGFVGNYGGIMGNYGGIMGNYGGIMGYYGELWGIVGNYGELWGIIGNYGEITDLGCHFVCYQSLFFVVVWPFASTDMSNYHSHNNVPYVRLSYLNKAFKEYISQG